MRLDKFLKVSRLIKRRTIANQLCDAGKISINGKVAKAGQVLKAGDQLAIELGSKTQTVVVETVPEKAVLAENAHLLYTILGETYNQSGTEMGS